MLKTTIRLTLLLLLPTALYGQDVGFTSSQNKVYFEAPYEFQGTMTDTGYISQAKNEYEAVQMVLFPSANLQNVTVELDELTRLTGTERIPAEQITVNVVGYVNQLEAKVAGDRIGWIPDPLLPNQALDLTANVPQPYLITVQTLDTTREGMYEGDIRVIVDGVPSKTLALRVKVWNFSLPAVPTFKTISLTMRGAPDDMWPGQVTSEAHRDTLLRKLGDLTFKNRIPITNALVSGLNSWNWNGSGSTDYGYPTHDGHVFNPTRTGELIDYVLSKGANNFFIGFTWDIYDPCCDDSIREVRLVEYLNDYRDYLNSRGLLHMAYVYNVDEPWDDQVQHAKDIYTLIKTHVGSDVRIMQNTNQNNASIIGTLMDYFDGLDINLGHYFINNSDYYRTTYPAQMSDFWWNVNIWPDSHPNLFVEYPLVDARIFGPLSFKFNMQGFEYWNVKSQWSIDNYHPIDSNELRVNWDVSLRSLDGSLVYPGTGFAIYSSMRFESFRDGMEDYEYLVLLKQQDSTSPLLDVDFITGLNTFTQDPLEILNHREQMGELLGSVVVDVGDDDAQLPADYLLDENYPNPFNAGTTIRFSLAETSKVNLSVYNVLGQKVTTIVDEVITAGRQSVTWDGRDGQGHEAPSGVYLYRLAVNDVTETRKMVLLR